MEKKWEEMSAQEKRTARFETWMSPQGVQFESPDTEAAYKAAVIRFSDAIQMEKAPDRVPILLIGTFMASQLYGVTAYEAMYDTDKLVSAHKRFLKEYGPDYYVTPALIGSGKILEILDYKQYKWPGHGISEQSAYQAVEGEYMLAEEYKALIDDPSDFWVRYWMPRV
ncbi:MAG: hypothetical protein H6Q55_1826, partial [Deltaproteobacteria bacterium]|nr:hypothetical protein [Deltaproteobacteria bacterium]